MLIRFRNLGSQLKATGNGGTGGHTAVDREKDEILKDLLELNSDPNVKPGDSNE